jgi:hypothetical protein
MFHELCLALCQFPNQHGVPTPQELGKAQPDNESLSAQRLTISARLLRIVVGGFSFLDGLESPTMIRVSNWQVSMSLTGSGVVELQISKVCLILKYLSARSQLHPFLYSFFSDVR